MTQPLLDVLLTEWERKGPFPLSPQLQELLGPGKHGPGVAALLGDKLRLTPGFGGLEITATSYVGRVEAGPLRVTIHPKIATTTLARMIKYVYGLADLWQPDLSTAVALDQDGLQDLLVDMLVREVERMWRAGLPRVYRRKTDRLGAIRGRIQVEALARQGVLTEPRIPCSFFERTADWHLNQVLLAGLRLGRRVCTQPALARRAERLVRALDGIEALAALTPEDVLRARSALTRLTDAAAPALDLIEVLLDGSGLALHGPRELMASAFLFDMNRFFQRFISRFLREHAAGLRVADEQTIRGLYRLPPADPAMRRRRPPAPRPDFAVSDLRGTLRMYLDAKYRDLWRTSLPADWLYQLSAYALASPNGASVLLYPTIAATAHEERIAVCDPASGSTLGSIFLRPVAIETLGRLAGSIRTADLNECADIAAQLVTSPAAPMHPGR
jgi:5-methylcytosine-specific restriction enzyme subunit McrC